jgi:hypothetical protein
MRIALISPFPVYIMQTRHGGPVGVPQVATGDTSPRGLAQCRSRQGQRSERSFSNRQFEVVVHSPAALTLRAAIFASKSKTLSPVVNNATGFHSKS